MSVSFILSHSNDRIRQIREAAKDSDVTGSRDERTHTRRNISGVVSADRFVRGGLQVHQEPMGQRGCSALLSQHSCRNPCCGSQVSRHWTQRMVRFDLFHPVRWLVFGLQRGNSGSQQIWFPSRDCRTGIISPSHLQSLRARNIGQEVGPSTQSACGRRGLPAAYSFGNWFGHQRLVACARGYESVGQLQQLAIDFCR